MHRRWNPAAPTVLVADDDPAARDFLNHVLADAGYNVRSAMDVAAATRCLLLPGIAAAVVDMLFVNSDGRSGLDLLRLARSNPNLEKIPVIVVTGFPLNHTVLAEIAELGAELWHKPFDPVALVQRLNGLLYATGAFGSGR